MIHVVKTFTNIGLQGYEIIVEADSNRSLPSIDIIGLPDAAIKEAKERIRATFRNVGIDLPRRKIIVNLAPSDIRKEGTRFDLPMAMAILLLCHEGKVAELHMVSEYLFFGELGLDGSVKRITGLLPTVISAVNQGYKHFFVPSENIYELEYIQGIILYPVEHFTQISDHFIGTQKIEAIQGAKNMEDLYDCSGDLEFDFSQIKGQLKAKRALSIAAAGMHNVLMVGSPGCGKTMLARALQHLLPPLGSSEILEVSQLYSLVGKLSKQQPLISKRPFRQVHHTASKISIIGGGSALTPGEVSLAHNGILFFDEVPEFPREVLEVLRQPIEDKKVCISRVTGTVSYPANFMFIGTMNPSPCGFYKDPEIECKSSIHEIKRYQSKVSGPLLDRIDMILEIPRVNIDTMLDDEMHLSTKDLSQQVQTARAIQQKRFANTKIVANAHMTNKDIYHYVPLGVQQKKFIKDVVEKLHLSPRVLHRAMKLARTIADIEESETVEVVHLAEALQYRNKTLFVE